MGLKRRVSETAAVRAWNRIERNSTATNLRFELGHRSVVEIENGLRTILDPRGLYISHITTLGRTRYPGNRHWHIKRSPKEPGCLDLTHWPAGGLSWLTMRNGEPAWVHQTGPLIAAELTPLFSS